MTESNLTQTSKFLSYILRHHPEAIGLDLDRHGWAYLPDLIEKAKKHGKKLDRDLIEKIIASGDKKRFLLSEDGSHIRAGYGHSIDVDLNMEPKSPPEKLFHGTARKNLDSIRKKGLTPGGRKYVHLSTSENDAINVGSRHGSPVILTIQAVRMHHDGNAFYQSESEPDIWLTEAVPPDYISFP